MERVGLYTRQSLYVMLLGFNASTLLVTAGELEDDASAAELIGGGFVFTAFAFAALVALLRRYPALHPLPWRQLGALLVAATAFIVWAEEAGGAVAMEAVNTAGPHKGELVGLRIE